MLEKVFMIIILILSIIGTVKLIEEIILHFTKPKDRLPTYDFLFVIKNTDHIEEALRYYRNKVIWQYDSGKKYYVVLDYTLEKEMIQITEKFCEENKELTVISINDFCADLWDKEGAIEK